MKLKNTLLILSLCATMLTSCSDTHKHSATEWDRDTTAHWQNCECGEMFNNGEHTVENSQCTVCESEIWAYDGGTDIYNYNENGEIVRITCYDADGNVYSENVTETEYDENGNKIRQSTYENGDLLYVTEFALSADGKSYEKSFKSYLQNGQSDVFEYDENGNITKSATYGEDGTVLYEEIYEYKTDSQGNPYPSKQTGTNYEIGTVSVYETNEYGEMIVSSEAMLDGTVIYEERYDREYDGDGNKLWEKHYIDGEIVDEVVEYTYVSDGDSSHGYPKKAIEYTADGLTKVFDYNDHGELLSEKDYDANGNIIFYFICEYEYDENGNLVSKKSYENGSLILEEEYAVGADGWTYTVSETTHYPDLGVSYHSEYNEYGDQTCRIVYDGEGNVTQEDIFEIEYDENGEKVSEKHYTDGVLTYEATDYVTDSDNFSWIRYPSTITRYYEDGSKQVTKNGKNGNIESDILYAADGSVLSEKINKYEYDENGEIKSLTVSENGITVSEEYYALGSFGFSFLEKEIAYFEDGSKLETTYDEFDSLLSVTMYAADGSVANETKYEYEYDTNNNVSNAKTYENGRLTKETVNKVDESGWLSYVEKEILYFEDGTKLVTEYDQNFNVISEKTYDADGNEIE